MVTFSCGCIGFTIVLQTPGREHDRLILWECDSDGHESALTMHWRNMKGKASVPLSEGQCLALTDSIGRAIYDGHKYEEIRSLLGVK